MQEDLGERAHVGCGTPSVLVRGNCLGEARELVFLNDDFGQHFGAVSGDAGGAVFVGIRLRCHANSANSKHT